jgi:hypothetical protein
VKCDRHQVAEPACFGCPRGDALPRPVGLTIGNNSPQDLNLIKQSRLSLIASSCPYRLDPWGDGAPVGGWPLFGRGVAFGESGEMLTSTECHEMAKQKLVQAEHEPQRRTRLLTAAQGWLVLENELRQLEASVIPPKASRSVQADLSRRRMDADVRRQMKRRRENVPLPSKHSP